MFVDKISNKNLLKTFWLTNDFQEIYLKEKKCKIFQIIKNIIYLHKRKKKRWKKDK